MGKRFEREKAELDEFVSEKNYDRSTGRDYKVEPAGFPYRQSQKYVVRDKYGNYQGGGNTYCECTQIIRGHRRNDELVEKAVVNDFNKKWGIKNEHK